MEFETKIVALEERAKQVLETEEFAKHWLMTPKKALGGQTPIDIAKTEDGLESVYQLLGRIEHGVFS